MSIAPLGHACDLFGKRSGSQHVSKESASGLGFCTSARATLVSYSPQLARHGGANPCRRGDRIRYLLIGNRAGSRVRPIEIRSLLILTHVRPPHSEQLRKGEWPRKTNLRGFTVSAPQSLTAARGRDDTIH